MGEFEVRTPEGEVTRRLRVVQTYESESDDLQRGRFFEIDREGAVVKADAENRREGDRLLCEVKKSNGETTEHEGTWTGDALVWHRRTDDGTEESFVERISSSEYQIDGAGVYGPGRTLFVFRGRYRRSTLDEAAAELSEHGIDRSELSP
jgi:hypothetical protein